MAPRTRSAAAKNGPTTNVSGDTNVPPTVTFNRDSTSSAPTPSTLLSDGEISTSATSIPTTSIAQAPAPPTTSKPRLVVELPQLPSDSPGSSRPSRSIRRRGRPYYVSDSEEEDEDDDDDYFPGDKSRSATLARKLQREEDSMTTVISTNTSRFQPAKRKSGPAKSEPSRGSKRVKVPTPKEYVPRDLYAEDALCSTKSSSGEGEDCDSSDSDDSDDSGGGGDVDDVPRNISFMKRKRDWNTEWRERKDREKDAFEKFKKRNGEKLDKDGVDIRYVTEEELKLLVPRRNYPDPIAYRRRMLELRHPILETMWEDLKNMPAVDVEKATQPANITRTLKPFQLAGLTWMKNMESLEWKGGVLGDEMGLGKTIQAVSLIMSDYPAKEPSLVLAPPVALMQWMNEISSYTSGQLKTLMFHGSNNMSKKMTLKDLKKYDVIIMSYNSLEAMHRKQEKGVFKNEGTYKEKSIIHQIKFHRIILDEAHCIKSRQANTAKACFALEATYRWCLTGTPLQNRIGEFFSLIRFLRLMPYAGYMCKSCPCQPLEWSPDKNEFCVDCGHTMWMHLLVFNHEVIAPIRNSTHGSDEVKLAHEKLNILINRIMLRRLKKDHMDSMELPVKEIQVNRQFFSEQETDFAESIMKNSKRQFNDYVARDVLLQNYANIFGLIMRMRQAADHPDLILKKDNEGGQNILVCCICDEPAEEAIRSKCKHDFCRLCAKNYIDIDSSEAPKCPQCHIPLSIDLEQPEIEQDSELIKKSSIINRIKMENWRSSTKIELLVHELHRLRSDKMCHKSIIFSQFTSMLQLVQWRLQRAGIATVMLDGSMNPAQRQASIDHFMKNVNVECFLVSLKAGGVALNLTEASRIFILDPWWNPAAEWQSSDRAHRIGQTRPCVIKRLCIEDSVESRMVLLQEKKSRMINSTVDAAAGSSLDTLSSGDLSFLFRMD
ncbi:SNF2 family N-terminal domain-containing protein [Annulohypoxylon moriforme]|nr:SNF2 family N-terminal domain-containing protein [Annulohypoxylon moriforme]